MKSSQPKKWKRSRVLLNVFGRGARSVVFCSNYQFRLWYRQFAAVNEKQNEADAVNLDIIKVIDRPLIIVDSKPLKISRTKGY